MNTTKQSDWITLLEGVKAGDKTSQTQFYTDLAVTLLPIVQSRLRGWSSVTHQDVLQETLITVSQKLKDINTQPHHFAAGILRNKIGDLLRSGKRRKTVSIDQHEVNGDQPLQFAIEQALQQSSPSENPLSRLESKDHLNFVVRSIKRLSTFCRQVFTSILKGEEISEIWEELKQTEPELKNSTFRKRIFDCRMRMKQLLLEG